MKPRIQILIVAAVHLILAGCGDSSRQQSTAKPTAVARVSVAQVQQRPILDVQKFMGTVQARSHAQIETKVQARVDRIAVSLGSHVRAGDVLAELDTRDLDARVRQAQALLEQTAQDLKRFETLLAQKVATPQEFDGVKARAAVADANRQEAEAMLDYARIVAPFSGVVTEKFIEAGDLAVPGRPLFGLQQDGMPRFVLTIPESNIGLISQGDSVRIEIPRPDTVLIGVAKELSPSANPITRSYEVKIDLPECSCIHPGQFGRLLLSTGESGALFVPSGAVVRRGQLEFVYIVGLENRVTLRLIRAGRSLSGWTEVLSGISEGETVAISGASGLTDGDQVERIP